VKRFLYLGSEEFAVVEADELRDDDAPRKFADEPAAREFLRDIARDTVNGRVLRDVLAQRLVPTGSYRWNDEDVLTHFARLLVSGHVVLTQPAVVSGPDAEEISTRAVGPAVEAEEPAPAAAASGETDTVPLRLAIGQPYGENLTGIAYELTVGEREFAGNVPASGVIEHDIPAGASTAELVVRPFDDPEQQFRWSLTIAQQEPVESVTGIQSRLNNLGFEAGAEDGDEGVRTRAAVRAFQRRHGLRVDGDAGPRTQEKLREIYGC
jgi:hypothetical protein